MPSEETNILEFNQYRKPDKIPSIVYVDLGSLIKKVDGCKTKPEKSSTTNVFPVGNHCVRYRHLML